MVYTRTANVPFLAHIRKFIQISILPYNKQFSVPRKQTVRFRGRLNKQVKPFFGIFKLISKIRNHRSHPIYVCVVVLDYPQGSNTGVTPTLVHKYPPGEYSYTTGVLVTPGTSTLPGYDTPPYTGGYFYPTRVRLSPGTSTLPAYDYPSYTRGYFYPARAGLPPGTSTPPGYDHPPYTGGYFYPARAGLPPGTSTQPGYDYPPYTGGYFYFAWAGLPPGTSTLSVYLSYLT